MDPNQPPLLQRPRAWIRPMHQGGWLGWIWWVPALFVINGIAIWRLKQIPNALGT